MTTPAVRHVPAARLWVSEPNPVMFGNRANPRDWKSAGWSNANWLKSRFHFSFADYFNQQNSSFGVLRVMNDDLVQPNTGFGPHPHHNMEILTYVVDGQLTHQDSMGSRETLKRGSVQFMTAGRGVRHSEANAGDTPCRFIQSWIVPRKQGLTPQYGSFSSDAEARHNTLLNVAGPAGSGAPITIEQDAHMYVGELDAGHEVALPLNRDRQAYLLCVEGSVVLDNGGKDSSQLQQHDAAELHGADSELRLSAGDKGAHVLMFVMKEDGSARSDF